MMAEKVANMRWGAPEGNQRASKTESSKDNSVLPDRKTRQQAAAELDVSEPSLDRARFIRKHGVPELVEAVESDKITVTRAAKIAKLPPEQQAEAMKDQVGAITTTASARLNLLPGHGTQARHAATTLTPEPRSRSIRRDTRRSVDALRVMLSGGSEWLRLVHSSPF